VHIPARPGGNVHLKLREGQAVATAAGRQKQFSSTTSAIPSSGGAGRPKRDLPASAPYEHRARLLEAERPTLVRGDHLAPPQERAVPGTGSLEQATFPEDANRDPRALESQGQVGGPGAPRPSHHRRRPLVPSPGAVLRPLQAWQPQVGAPSGPLSELVICAACGNRFAVSGQRRKSSRVYSNLRCSANVTRGQPICANSLAIAEQKLVSAGAHTIRGTVDQYWPEFERAFRAEWGLPRPVSHLLPRVPSWTRRWVDSPRESIA
jgi:Recombinase zinc beta ribbon domain